LVKEAAKKRIEKLEKDNDTLSTPTLPLERVILIAFGLNRTNVAARITESLRDAKCNIQDVSQKMMGNFFMLTLLIDISHSTKNINQIQEEMDTIAGELGIKIYIHHEDSFR